MKRAVWIVVALAVIVVLISGVVIAMTLNLSREDTAGESVEQSTAPVQPAPVAQGDARIAFISDNEGMGAVYLMDGDGANRERLSEDEFGVCVYPAWSPDNQQVAYWRAEGETYIGDNVHAGLWVSTADGSSHVLVSPDNTRTSVFIPPTWSHDGTRLAYQAQSYQDDGSISAIHIVYPDGSGLNRTILLPWLVQYLSWAPDSDDLLMVRLSRTSAGSVYLWSSETSELVEVYTNVEAASWGPSSQQIAIGDRAAGSVVIVGRDWETQALASIQAGHITTVQWSPDGSRIAVGIALALRRGMSFSLYFSDMLYLVSLESGEITSVIENQGRIHQVNWSPDGSHLLFTLVGYGVRTGGGLPYADLVGYDVNSGELAQLTDETGFAGLGFWPQ